MNVENALRTWASIERNGHPRNGWYKTQPWYRPELVGYRVSAPVRTSQELAEGEKVGGIVAQMALEDRIHADALRIGYGAFPGAEQFNGKQRARLFFQSYGIQARDFYRIRDHAKSKVEGALLYGA